MINNKLRKSWSFKKTFLVADISMDVVLEISYFTLSSTDNNFTDNKLNRKSYITIKTLFTTKWVELVVKKELVAIAFD